MTKRKQSETSPEPWAWLEGVDANGSPVAIEWQWLQNAFDIAYKRPWGGFFEIPESIIKKCRGG